VDVIDHLAVVAGAFLALDAMLHLDWLVHDFHLPSNSILTTRAPRHQEIPGRDYFLVDSLCALVSWWFIRC
jgi:hypothetical protein